MIYIDHRYEPAIVFKIENLTKAPNDAVVFPEIIRAVYQRERYEHLIFLPVVSVALNHHGRMGQSFVKHQQGIR